MLILRDYVNRYLCSLLYYQLFLAPCTWISSIHIFRHFSSSVSFVPNFCLHSKVSTKYQIYIQTDEFSRILTCTNTPIPRADEKFIRQVSTCVSKIFRRPRTISSLITAGSSRRVLGQRRAIKPRWINTKQHSR